MSDVTKMSIRELAQAIGWSRRQVADMAEIDERTVRGWDDPRRRETAPPDVRALLEQLAAFHLAQPIPQSILERRARRRAA